MERNSYITSKSYRVFLLASIANILILQVNALIDGMILGQCISPDAMSAINVCSPIYNAIMTLPIIIAMGATISSARELGMGNYEKVNKGFNMTLVSCSVLCLVIAFILLGYSDSLLYILSDDRRLTPYIHDYLPWVGFVALAFAIQNSYTYYLATCGKANLVVKVSMLQMASNLILDTIFIWGLGIGMGGAAFATIISYIAGLVIAVPAIRSEGRVFSLCNPFRKWFLSNLGEAFAIGTACGMAPFVMALVVAILNTLAQKVSGADGVFVVSIFMQMFAVGALVTEGAVDTLETLGSISWGEHDMKGYKILFAKVMRFSIVVLLLIAAVMICMPDALCTMFGADEVLSASSSAPVRILSVAIVMAGLCTLLGGNLIVVERIALSLFVGLGCMVALTAFAWVSATYAPDKFWLSISAGLTLWFVVSIAVLAITARITKMHHWLSMIPKYPETPSIDFSVPYNDKEVSTALSNIQQFLTICELKPDTRNNIGTCIEEIISKVTHQPEEEKATDKNKFFDIRVMEFNDNGHEIHVTIKYSGKPFAITSTLCDKIDSNNRNGINCVSLTFPL